MKKSFREGFTLVELALSMAFVGILSVSVVLIVSDTVASYRRGLTLTQINSTGMELVDDMRLAVTNTSARAVSASCSRYYDDGTVRQKCEEDGAYSFVTLVRVSDVTLYEDDAAQKKTLYSVPIYGAFCTGSFSYIWNTGYYDMKEASFPEKTSQKWAKFTYNTNYNNKPLKVNVVGSLGKDASFKPEAGEKEIDVGSEDKPFRLLKIHDTNRAVCMGMARPTKSIYYTQEDIDDEDIGGLDNVFDISSFGVLDYSEPPEDLILTNSDSDLALFDLYVAKPAESTTQKNMLYSVSFVLGTVGGGANVASKGRSCETPTNYEYENFDYCAINKFNFAMQASGEL